MVKKRVGLMKMTMRCKGIKTPDLEQMMSLKGWSFEKTLDGQFLGKKGGRVLISNKDRRTCVLKIMDREVE